MDINTYKYDISISLCKQDIEFARKLAKALNPSLSVFFYEDRQEELISKSGPEAFAKVFKEESRVVIILSRKEWSETFYTDIERNAIIDRTSVRNQGYSFLLVIPMEIGESPSWYPSTKIYLDPRRFSVEQLAKFAEFKVTDTGGIVRPLTSEEYSTHFINQLKEKREIVQLQSSQSAIKKLISEIKKVKTLFNAKIEHFSSINHLFHLRKKPFSESIDDGEFGLGEHLLRCEIYNIDTSCQLVSTQTINLIRTFYNARTQNIESKQYKFYYSDQLCGWSIPQPYSGNNNSQIAHLFTEYGNGWYDLKSAITSETMVDDWFTELWQLLKQNYKEIV